MSLYNRFVEAIQQSNHNIVVVFIAALGIVLAYTALNWFPDKWQPIARKFYLGWWLLIFVLFYFTK